MNRFEPNSDPLLEKITDEELRDLLHLLGEAELGGDDQATVGAVIEATGADAMTVLHALGEVRHRLHDEQRSILAEMELRVARLENGRMHEPLTTHDSTGIDLLPASISGDAIESGKEDSDNYVRGVVAVFLMAVIPLVACAIAWTGIRASATRASSSSYSSASTLAVERIVTIPTVNGTIVLHPGGALKVVRSDGTTREATTAEKDRILMQAAYTR